MSVSCVFCAQVELHDRRGDSIPEGWGCDEQGKLTMNPKKVLNGGGLVPIGGSEATGQKRPKEKRIKNLSACTVLSRY